MADEMTSLDIPNELRARAKGSSTDKTHDLMLNAASLIDGLDDCVARHAAFVRYLRRHLDGFLGDILINAASLRKAMEDYGV